MTSPGAEVSAVSAANSHPQGLGKSNRFRQRPLGPAPFASFEDSSDELDSPPESAKAPSLPNIKEDPASQLTTPVSPQPPDMNQLNLTEEEERGLQEALAASLDAPAPPRIDISRASSSSQHEDSITSSPDADCPGNNLGYKEDGALELKSSTEELYYISEPGTVEETEAKRRREKRMQKQLRQDFGDTQSEHDFKERKDSNCSVASDFGGHLYIGGRTSRLSSVGSGNSVASAASHMSGASRLSAGSKVSRGSRSPSPHKMMLETSFCGGRPGRSGHTAAGEPATASHILKPSSRPPSRLRSRSPSPHKVLLETSFCGTKALGSADAAASDAAATIIKESDAEKKSQRRRSSSTLTPEVVTTVEIATQPSETAASKKANMELEQPVKLAASKPRSKPIDIHEIRKADDGFEVSPRSYQRKPLNLAQMMERKIAQENSKPKKKKKPPVSLRDIPGDEIFIPLTGPEVDFEELIRKSSPNLPRKQPSEENPDVIFIPLHSPPKEKEISVALKETSTTGISEARTPSKTPKPYEVCEDGSIYIPLHTPEEEKGARTFEEEIKRVERELQRVREAEAARREREREQHKPATLDLQDSTSNRSRSRLSQSYPGKQDVVSGSRTPSPSPGSSLSRRSSFASLFRRSELTASPDSPASTSTRKKSGTLSNILKDATDGRSRSRSKERSRERLPSSTSVSRSPSFKKNALSNIFGGRKKEEKEPRVVSQVNTNVPRADVQFTFTAASFQGEDMGDYIFIPLKDPNAPQSDNNDTLEQEVVVELTKIQSAELESTQVRDTEEDSSSVKRKSGGFDENADTQSQISDRSMLQLSTVGAAYRTPVEEKQAFSLEDSKQEVLPLSKSKQSIEPEEIAPAVEPDPSPEPQPVTPQELPSSQTFEPSSEILTTSVPEASTPPKTEASPVILTTSVTETLNFDPISSKPSLKPHEQEGSLQDSSVELDDDLPHEEIVTVSTDGIRKLKLPPEPGDLDEDHERKGLVVQDSLEDELPYVPTTLPLERTLGVTLIPAKERISEVMTCPIDRPRSTTPKNPAALDDYLARRDSNTIPDKEKMKISLPRIDSTTGRVKSPRRFSGKGKTWFEFAEAGIPTPRDGRKSSLTKSPSPPPLPPRADQFTNSSQDLPAGDPTTPGTTWVNFEELPEKRKLPKRITTLPVHRGSADGAAASEKPSAPIVYSYVNPEDCQCECHDHSGGPHVHTKTKLVAGMQDRGQAMARRSYQENGATDAACNECDCGDYECDEDVVDADERIVARELEECPLLDGNSDDESISRREMDCVFLGSRLEVEQPHLSDSSFEAMSIGPDHSPGENGSEMIPFAMDLDVQSNRSSIISQNEETSPEGMT